MDRDEFLKKYTEPFRYKDTNRDFGVGSIAERVKKAHQEKGLVSAGLEGLQGISEPFDAFAGAPYRKLLLSLAQGRGIGSVGDAVSQIGKDPENAPTGADVAEAVFTDPADVAKRTAMATLTDVTDLGSLAGGVGLLGKAAKAGKLPFGAKIEARGAKEILDEVNTVDKAVGLVPEAREEYLKALDEVYGDRAKRAKDLGFGKQTWYHGTGSDIKEFDPSLLQTNASGPTASKAFHFAKDPKLANQYAYSQAPDWYKKSLAEDRRLADEAIGSSERLRQKYGKDWDLQATKEELANHDLALKRFKDFAENERPKYEARADALPEGAEFESGNNVVPVKLKTKSMVGQEMDGASVSYDEAKLLDDTKKEGKHGGVVFKNAYDNLNNIRFDAPDLMVPSTDIAAVFNPKDIRSVNAAFDPRFKDSANLLAGAAPAFGLKDLLNYKEDEKNKKRPRFEK
jgi:hypothetical protein